MMHRELGRTSLRVSAIAVGTVALGASYGIRPSEERQPSRDEAIALLRTAADRGITLFDTAPAYGTAEEIVGAALGDRAECVIATKVNVPAADVAGGTHAAVLASIERSRRALRRDVLDLVQIHNATTAVVGAGDMADALAQARARGWIRATGASVYTPGEAVVAIESGAFDMIQLPFSILDQRPSDIVFDLAQRHRVGILTRSVLLKGALTHRAEHLPPQLDGLRDAARRAQAVFGSWEALPVGAIRFGISEPRVSSVLVGVRDQAELDEALAALDAGPLDGDTLLRLAPLALRDEKLVNPALWPAA